MSAKNLNAAIAQAENCITNKNTSLSKLQNSLSALDKALNSLSYKAAGDTQKGSLNITNGKIAAAVIFGLLILAAQIYVHKMQKKKQTAPEAPLPAALLPADCFADRQRR